MTEWPVRTVFLKVADPTTRQYVNVYVGDLKQKETVLYRLAEAVIILHRDRGELTWLPGRYWYIQPASERDCLIVGFVELAKEAQLPHSRPLPAQALGDARQVILSWGTGR